MSAPGLPCQLSCIAASPVPSVHRGPHTELAVLQTRVFCLSVRSDQPGYSGDLECIFLDNLQMT